MNYYRRFMADYGSKTASLSLAEHGAYNLLLDTCYSTERGLPASYDALYRLCRAMTKPEQDAVKSVADAFFQIGQDGLRHNPRADEEIVKAQATIAKQRESGVESAARRWSTDGSTHRSTDSDAIQPPTSISQPLAFDPLTPLKAGSRNNGAHPASKDETPVIQTLPLLKGGDFEVRQSFVTELAPLYPRVDVPATLNEMKGWLIGNPARRKTRSGIRRFITSWLQSEQQKAEAH